MKFNNNRMSETALAFAAGIGIGALIGLVFAPSSGEEMRDNLLGIARDGMDDVSARGRRLVKGAKKAVETIGDDFAEVAAEGGRAYREAKNAAS